MTELTQFFDGIIYIAGISAAIGTIGGLAWKIKKWLQSQTDLIYDELKTQHNCIKKVESNTNVLAERTEHMKSRHEQIASKLDVLERKIEDNTNNITILQTTLEYHLKNSSK